MVTAYILLTVFLESAWSHRKIRKVLPDSQHHLCEEGARNERERGEECGFVASVSWECENGDNIRGPSMRFVHLGHSEHHKSITNVNICGLGMMWLTFVEESEVYTTPDDTVIWRTMVNILTESRWRVKY